MYRIIIALLFTLTPTLSWAQTSMQHMAKESFKNTIHAYPNLKDAKIRVKYTTRGSAMAASYRWWSVFRKPNKRAYRVKINTNVSSAFMCFQFDHLSDSARNGVMGHELAHVDFFHELNFFGFMKFIINQGLPNGLRKSERATDVRTIEHGLGHQLRAWSHETRTRFLESEGRDIPAKFGNRYLEPAEIDSVMKLHPSLY